MSKVGRVVAPVVAAVLLSALLLWVTGAPPFETFRLLVEGSVGTATKLSDTLVVFVPLALAAASLCITFAAGLWNIGVEGQIIMGAIAAAFVSRTFAGSPGVLLTAVILAGIVGGALWGLLAGVLKAYGGVNEIFAGLGLDFAATGIAILLILGPWKRAGVASTSGTELFDEGAFFPTFGTYRISPLALALAVVGVLLVTALLARTNFGLRLRAVGANPAGAARLGVPVRRVTLWAFALGGGLAGVAGAVQTNAVHHKLVPAISGGYGFLAILLVLLAGKRPAVAAAVGLFFAAVGVGASQLELRLDLDSAVAGVFEALLVLLVLAGRGLTWQRQRRNSLADT